MLDDGLAQRNEMSAVDGHFTVHSICNFYEVMIVFLQAGGYRLQVNSCLFVYHMIMPHKEWGDSISNWCKVYTVQSNILAIAIGTNSKQLTS